MFGNVERDKKLKEIEDNILLLKTDIKMKFQKLDWANNLIQIRKMQAQFEETEKEVNKKIDALDQKIQELKNLQAGLTNDFPDIPWLKEIIDEPRGERFDCLPPKQKLRIWENIFNNIGLGNEKDLIAQYPFHLSEIEIKEASMIELGLIYLAQLGTRNKNLNGYILNFDDFKIYSDDYAVLIKGMLSMGNPDLNFQDYQAEYLEDSNEHKIVFKVNDKLVNLKFPHSKYFDESVVEYILKETLEHIDSTRFHTWLHANNGSFLLFLTHYQKSILERLLHMPNKLKDLNPV